MKYIFFLSFMFSITTAVGQHRTFTLISFEDNIPLDNAMIYSDDLFIGKTNTDGNFNVDISKIKYLTITKEGFNDIKIATNKITSLISLEKITTITLEEIAISKIGLEEIIKNSLNTIENEKLYRIPDHVKYYNSFIKGNDTLHYFNNRMIFKNGLGVFSNFNTPVIARFKSEKYDCKFGNCEFTAYHIKNKKIAFFKNFHNQA